MLGPSWGEVRANRVKLKWSPKLERCCSQLGAKLEPSWGQVRAKVGSWSDNLSDAASRILSQRRSQHCSSVYGDARGDANAVLPTTERYTDVRNRALENWFLANGSTMYTASPVDFRCKAVS